MYARTLASSKRLFHRLALITLIAGSAAAAGSASPDSEHAKHASILEIVLNCQKFDGREVTVLGAVALEFENQSVCPTKEFLEADTLNCLWLAPDESWPQKQIERVSKGITRGDYLVIDGTVSCKDGGHLSLYGASLNQITFILHQSRSEILWDASSSGSTQ